MRCDRIQFALATGVKSFSALESS